MIDFLEMPGGHVGPHPTENCDFGELFEYLHSLSGLGMPTARFRLDSFRLEPQGVRDRFGEIVQVVQVLEGFHVLSLRGSINHFALPWVSPTADMFFPSGISPTHCIRLDSTRRVRWAPVAPVW